MTTNNWTIITESNYSWEREALEYIRKDFPPHEPYRAWTNFEFIANDGSINEVDLLVFTPQGLFLIEIKSRPGRLSGDAGTWIWENNGKTYVSDNPLIGANSKAKKLRSLLEQQKMFRGKQRLPFIEALVFCSAPDLKCDLQGTAKFRVCLRDRLETETIPARVGIIATLLRRECAGLDAQPKGIHDRPMGKSVAKAMEQSGIRVSQKQRKVSDYILDRCIGEGHGYQDWSSYHVSLPNMVRRVRLYLVRSESTDSEKQIIERAAIREFQLLESLQHPGILRTHGYTEHSLGPAIIFEHDPSYERLDRYLVKHRGNLSVDVRLELLRQITEAVAYAHQKRVVHRALCPQSILVVELSRQRRQIKIFNWQAGYRGESLTTGGATAIAATNHVDRLVDDVSTAYLAPESLSNVNNVGEHLDIFSLGAIAYHLFADTPPATNSDELSNKLRATKGLQISSVVDGVGKELQDLIQWSTYPDVSLRMDSTSDFLERLEMVEEELTSPHEMFVEDPNLAQKGAMLPGHYQVLNRLGQGGSALAFLVERDGQEFVMKVANDAEHNDRLSKEAEVLQKLRHESIVEFREKVLIGDREAFLLNPIYVEKKSEKRIETLGQRLRRDGRLHIELLERFGEDLLNAVRYLEEQGVCYHRDIKPDNIVVGQVGRGDRLHAVLFDFSLAGVPPENIRAGTTGYLDPLLPLREPPRWDSYAERYAAAITLHELATGMLPKWGDGLSDPSHLDCEITIDAELFDLSLRDSLPDFFRRAFRRQISERFDNAEEMLREWRACFEGLEPSITTLNEEDLETLQAQIAIATGETKIAEMGLGARAVQALDRNNILTVKDLLSVQTAWLLRLRGVGNKTRREIADVVKQLRERIDIAESETGDLRQPKAQVLSSVDPDKFSIDQLVLRTTRVSSKGGESSQQVVHGFLGLLIGIDKLLPKMADVAQSLGMELPNVQDIIAKARARWIKEKAIVKLRSDLAEMVDLRGKVMSLDEAASAILVARGSVYDEPKRTQYAIAILRIALEVEAEMTRPRFALYRKTSQETNLALIATNEEAFNDAIALGQAADLIAQNDPLLPPSRAVEQLRRLSLQMLDQLSDARLMRLAAVSSNQAALSSRQEFYPRGMDAGRALKLSQGALFGVKTLRVAEIRDRIASRYPEAASLPEPPELDGLLAAAGLEFRWDATGANGWGCYVSRLGDSSSMATDSFSRQPTAVGVAMVGEIDEAAADARLFEERLQRGLKHGAFMVMLVLPQYYVQAINELSGRLAISHRDFEKMLLDALRQVADRAKVNWDLVIETDAKPYEGDWDKLLLLVDRALVLVDQELAESDRTVLLSHVGMLARYDRLNWLEKWRDRVGAEIAGLWVLVPGDRQAMIDGKAIPLLSPAQKTTVPKSWLENRHRM